MVRKLAIFVFLLPAVAYAGEHAVFDADDASSVGRGPSSPAAPGDSDGRRARTTAADGLPGVWLGDMFYRALSNFTVRPDVGSAACQKQTEMYVWHLRNNSYWAVKSEYYELRPLSLPRPRGSAFLLIGVVAPCRHGGYSP